MRLSGRLQAPAALTRDKDPQYPLNGPKGGLDCLKEERTLLLLLGIEPRFLCRPAPCAVTIVRLFLSITLPDWVSLKERQSNILDRMASDINIMTSLYVTPCILADR
jgi:hypothetical protein